MRNYAIFDDSIGHLQWRRGENTNLHDFPALDGDFTNFFANPYTYVHVYLYLDSLIPLKGGLSIELRGGITLNHT